MYISISLHNKKLVILSLNMEIEVSSYQETLWQGFSFSKNVEEDLKFAWQELSLGITEKKLGTEELIAALAELNKERRRLNVTKLLLILTGSM